MKRQFLAAMCVAALLLVVLAAVATWRPAHNVTASNEGLLPVARAASLLPTEVVKYEGADTDAGRLYVMISMLPSTSRKGFYDQFTPRQKSAVWQLHLTMIRLNYEKLSPKTEALFDEALALMKTTDFDSDDDKGSKAAQGKAISDAVERVLGKGSARRLFSDLGSALSLQPVGAVVQKARFDGGCGCNDYWNYCGDGKVCTNGADNCTASSSGCGFLWWYPCNGMCKDKPNAD